MLSPDRVQQIFTLGAAGVPTRAIARRLGHSPQTVRDYLHQRRTPGVRAVSRPGLFTDLFADYCRQRLAEDPDLRPSSLFRELTGLGFGASRSTFYRGLTRRLLSPTGRRKPQTREQTPPGPPETSRLPSHAPALPRLVAPVTGEVLISYLTRLAHANHLTLTEVLAVLPSWFSTKISNRDDRAQHHISSPQPARPWTRSPDSPAQLLPASPARSPPSAPPTRTAPSGLPPPATGAPPATGSASPSPSTCPPTTRSAPGTASGSATPASPISTSPPAPRSSPPSTGPASSCAAARPRN